MRGTGIFDGDFLIIDRGIGPRPDDIVIAILHGELSVKRLLPLIFTNTSSRCQSHCWKPFIWLTRWRRMSAANNGPKRFHHSRTAAWQMAISAETGRANPA